MIPFAKIPLFSKAVIGATILGTAAILSAAFWAGYSAGKSSGYVDGWDEGRAALALEIGAAAAEKHYDDEGTLREIEGMVNDTPDNGLADLILNGGWLLPEAD